MLLYLLIIIPTLTGIFLSIKNRISKLKKQKIVLMSFIINFIISLILYILFDLNLNEYQFIQKNYNIAFYNMYLGIDGISIYFILLTTMIMPIVVVSNWDSINKDIESYLFILLILEVLLILIFMVLDTLFFYIFFESILLPLFLLIGLFGSKKKIRASFYFFLYTLYGSLFLLISILFMSSITGTTDFDLLFKSNFYYVTQVLLFCGIFFAFAVKTPTIFFNNWLLKAHVESPLGGSIILAAIVLKLSIYGILRLILPIIPESSLNLSNIVYVIGVITILYASISTLRTVDIKELIAYSSVSHAAVYILGVFSNIIQGIEGSIILGLAHGFVSSSLFICAGGVLYDRVGTRLIFFYKGIAQTMPIFSILFFISCLGNCGAPLTLNFIGEFMSLYAAFEKIPLLGVFASFSIIFSAGFTIYMFNRISFGGVYSKFFENIMKDLYKREFIILFILVLLTVVLGIYPSFILDGLHYSVTNVIYYI
jgi:NADH-ubiquinone oxidoreductase chain 4